MTGMRWYLSIVFQCKLTQFPNHNDNDWQNESINKIQWHAIIFLYSTYLIKKEAQRLNNQRMVNNIPRIWKPFKKK